MQHQHDGIFDVSHQLFRGERILSLPSHRYGVPILVQAAGFVYLGAKRLILSGICPDRRRGRKNQNRFLPRRCRENKVVLKHKVCGIATGGVLPLALNGSFIKLRHGALLTQ
jgi:hypothetical protein